MAYHSTVGAGLVTPEGETQTDAMAQRVQNLFKFRNFYHQMDFSRKQYLAIIGLTNPSGGLNLAEQKPQVGRLEDISMTFCKSDAQGLLSHHNRPLHVTDCIRDVKGGA